MSSFILALDQGTTSSRALLISSEGEVVADARYPIGQHYPKPGWVEHDPMEILHSQLLAAGECFLKSGLTSADIAGVGITNQRETALVWERATGKPIYNAIVWQCRRTAELCTRLTADGLGGYVREKTGLLIDAYISATKFKSILDEVPGARARAARGELLCGTVDSWLIWNLTKGAAHVSDYSNCSRTMLFDIGRLRWDETLCRAIDVPLETLPKPVPNSVEYGKIAPGIKGLEALSGVSVCGAAGDQQAALFGQACFAPGQTKNTYGTGCFTLTNLGESFGRAENGLLTSVGWSLGGKTVYVLEGSVFNAGSAIQWLRDELGLIKTARECDVLAESVPDNNGVYMVPAFTGLGAPYWDMYARGAVMGLTRGAGRAHLCRAVLEGIAYQVTDLIRAMTDRGQGPEVLRADGGASVSDFLMQYQADLLGIPVERPKTAESTAMGAAWLAGLCAGVWADTRQLERTRRVERVFYPQTDRSTAYAQWHKAAERTMGWEGF